ncbi:hypothetical protein Hanom_Chr05g00473721 [Helianthus anomalus]
MEAFCLMGSTDSPPPPLCCSVFVFESFRVSGQWLTMVALVLMVYGLVMLTYQNEVSL